MNGIGRLLPDVVRHVEDSPLALEAAAFAAWAEAAGASTRRSTAALRLEGKLLHVAVADATWKKQLESLAPQLIFRINGTLGASLVTRLAFHVDPGAVDSASADLAERVDEQAIAACMKLLEPQAQSIADPELRALFLRAAGKCLARTTGRPKLP